MHVLLEYSGSVQSTKRLGSPGTSANAAELVPMPLTSTILGGAASSWIYLTLREEAGYTYGAAAGARAYRNGGIISAAGDVRNAVSGAALAEFFNEYRKIADGGRRAGSEGGVKSAIRTRSQPCLSRSVAS